MTARSIPSASPTPIAPRRFITLCSPTSGEAISKAPARRVHVHVNPVHARAVLPRTDHRRGAETEGERRQVEPRHHRRSRRIVGIDDRGAPGLGAGGEQAEEARLGIAVGVERHVKVEVVLRQVGEDGDVEFDAVRPVQGQRVGGDFHGDARHARARPCARGGTAARAPRASSGSPGAAPRRSGTRWCRSGRSGGPGRAGGRRRGSRSSSCRSCR